MTNLKCFSAAIFFSILFSLSFHVRAESPAPAELFALGTKAYSSKDYPKAAELFSQALDKDPNNSVTLTNLALTQFQLEKKPLAVGLLRKALALDPELSIANSGLKFVLSQMQVKEVPHKIETYESLRSNFVQPVPVTAYLILSAICLFASGWILISYGGRRKKALNEEKAPPAFPFIEVFLALSFILTTGLLSLKLYDSTIIRGTVIEDQISMQTAPGDNGVSILDLYGGMEVVVNSNQGEWVQVTYPGSFTGWIKKSALLMTR